MHVPYTLDLADLTREELITRRKDWVVKRSMGRVGDQVFVGELYAEDDWIPLIDQFREARAEGQVWLAQRFVRQRTVPTPWGNRYLTLGAYVQNGRFVGYYARITPRSHVSHDALCVPVFFAPSRGEREEHDRPLARIQKESPTLGAVVAGGIQ